MKMSHLYFDKYCTRKVQLEKSSGLFQFDGQTISREYLEDSGNKSKLANTLSSIQQTQYDHIGGAPQSIEGEAVRTTRGKVNKKKKELHPEEKAELRAKEIAVLKHVYHDDNFVRINTENKAMVTASKRVWLPSHQQLQFTTATQCGTVVTAKQPNKRLGLTPLRMYGGGQDKPHHIATAKNYERLQHGGSHG